MIVLSLFDGMSCGQIALNQLGLKVTKYFAAEIKQHAIKCTQHNFMLENVASMSVDNKSTIDELLGVTGIFINSTLFSAQLRKRYYWTNINVDLDIEDRGVELQSILESGYTARKKSVCIVRNYAGSVQSSNKDSFIRMCNARSKKGFLTVVYEEKGNPDSVRLFTQTELERLQTVPVGYTSCVTYQEAADLIGDGWNIETVKHIFKNMNYEI